MLIQSLKHLSRVVARLTEQDIKWFVADTETVPRPQWKDKDKSTLATLIHPRMQISMFSFCYKGESYSMPTSAFDPKYPTMPEIAVRMTPLLDFLRKKRRRLVMHNGNYDIRVLVEEGWGLDGVPVWDTAIGAWLSDGNADKSLKSRLPRYGRHQVDTKTVDFTNIKQLAAYAEDDVIATDEFFQMQMTGKVERPAVICYLGADGGIARVRNPMPKEDLILRNLPGETLSAFDRIFLQYQELPVLRATLRAENTGVCIDWAQLQVIRTTIDTKIKELKKKVFRMAGKVFNLNSTDQLGAVMGLFNIKSPLKTKGGAESWNAESLFHLKGRHPVVDLVMEYRKASKLQSTYAGDDGLEFYRNPKTRRVHCNLNTTGAVTGRFSSSNPNLQNIPARADTYGIRKAFVAPKGKTLICLDFSQVELRVMAQLSQDPVMMKTLNDPKGDIHQTSADGFHVPRDPVAKQCNFLLIFGGGPYVLARGLTLAGVPTDESQAKVYIDGFDSLYERPKQWRIEMLSYHKQFGYVPLLCGRRRIIKGADSTSRYELHRAETQLANNVVQGSAQDFIKAAIVRCDPLCVNPDAAIPRVMEVSTKHLLRLRDMSKRLEKLRKLFTQAKLELHLQVHDELLYSCDPKAAPEVAHRIAEVMGWHPYWEPIMELNVVIRADGGIGDCWSSAKKPKDDLLKVHPTAAPFTWALK